MGMVVLVIVSSGKEGNRHFFHWANHSIEVMIEVPFEIGKIVTGLLRFEIHGKSIIRHPSSVVHLMYGVRSMFVAMVVIPRCFKEPAKLTTDPRDMWEIATSQSEVSTDCLDGRSLRIACSIDEAMICWRNSPDWDCEVRSSEFDFVIVRKADLEHVSSDCIEFLNQFFSNKFDCSKLDWTG